MHKIYTFVLVLFLSNFLGIAQTTQPGIVQEYNEKAKKTPLAGVELNVRSANNTVSDKGGRFSLQFLTLKPGDYVAVRRIEKLGYEIFNKEAVEQWNLNPDRPFVIVMCRSDKFKQLRDNYEKVASESYARQLKKDQAALEKLKAEGKLKETEYQQQRLKLIEDYEKQLDNLENYVDRFSRIDLSELTAAEQEIIELVKAGKMDEAIARYDQMNIVDNLLKEIQKRDEVRAVISRLEEEKKSISESNDSLYAMADRHIQTLLLAGGSENNRKVADIYRKIADADTTNVRWLLKTGDYLENYVADNDAALKYYNLALIGSITNSDEKDILVAMCYDKIAMVYYTLVENDKALHNQMKSLEILSSIYEENSLQLVQFYRNLAEIYSNLNDYDNELQVNLKILNIFNRNTDLIDDIERFLHYATLSSNYASVGNNRKAHEFDCLMEDLWMDHFGEVLHKEKDEYERLNAELLSIFFLSEEKNRNYFGITMRLYGKQKDDFFGYRKLGSFFFSQQEFEWALNCYLMAQNDLDASTNRLGQAINLIDIADSLTALGLGEEAISYYNRGRVLMESVLDSSHPNIAVIYDKLSLCYSLIGMEMEKRDAEKKAYNIWVSLYGEKHPASIYSAGKICENIDDLNEKLNLYLKLQDMCHETFSYREYAYNYYYATIADIYKRIGDREKALKYLVDLFSQKEEIFGKYHQDLCLEAFEISMEFRMGNDYDNAIIYSQKAIDIGEHIYNTIDNTLMARIYYCHAQTLSEIKRYEESLQYLKKAIPITESFYGFGTSALDNLYIDIYGIYCSLCLSNNKYKQEFEEFMSDKVFTATVVEGDTPAGRIGLYGEYYIMEFGDWNCQSPKSLFDKRSELQGKPKDLVIMKDGKISRHHFEDKIGIMLGIKKVGKEESRKAKEIYQQWKSNQ